MVRELKPEELANRHKINSKLIQHFIMYKPYSDYKPIQYATVWNDATPAMYMEVDRSTSRMYIQSLYDDKYLYTHFIMANSDYETPAKDLRDIVQYVDNANDAINTQEVYQVWQLYQKICLIWILLKRGRRL